MDNTIKTVIEAYMQNKKKLNVMQDSGSFTEDEISNQTIITLRLEEEVIIALGTQSLKMLLILLKEEENDTNSTKI